MGTGRTGKLLAATAVLAILVVPVAIAGSADDGAGPQRVTSASIKKKFKKLRGQVKRLQQQVDALSARPSGQQGDPGPQGVQGPQGVAGPAGSIQGATAGGDLSGTYPNPQIAANAVGTNEIANNSVAGADVDDATLFNDNSLTAADLGTGSVAGDELAANSVRAAEIGNGIVTRNGSPAIIAGGTAENGSYTTGTAEAECTANEEVITGYGGWEVEDPDVELFIQGMLVDHDLDTVSVTGGNDDDVEHELTAFAVCLQFVP